MSNNEKNLQDKKGQLIGVFNYDLKAGTETFIRANPLKDWTEDFEHENGNYQCLCISCQSYFLGYKRRNTCKECASTIPEVKAALPGGGENWRRSICPTCDGCGEMSYNHLCSNCTGTGIVSAPPASKPLQECFDKYWNESCSGYGHEDYSPNYEEVFKDFEAGWNAKSTSTQCVNKTLEERKDDIARSRGYESWTDLKARKTVYEYHAFILANWENIANQLHGRSG